MTKETQKVNVAVLIAQDVYGILQKCMSSSDKEELEDDVKQVHLYMVRSLTNRSEVL